MARYESEAVADGLRLDDCLKAGAEAGKRLVAVTQDAYSYTLFWEL